MVFFFTELKEDVLHDLLDLPAYMEIRKAVVTKVHARVSWTNLKTIPVQLVGLITS